MNKTFKKAIAVILSVLMVVLSVPFTALAAPGDYEPNLKMYFGTFVEDNATNYTDYSTCGTSLSSTRSCIISLSMPLSELFEPLTGFPILSRCTK